QRIAAVDKVLSAYITVCGEQAREVAQATEKMIGAGYHLGPLHGIPIAIKDNIYTRGVRTTAGSKILADFIPAEDATVTARLKRAGAVIIGKTNLHEFAWGGTTDNPHYGTCRNPWNPERFPAGSSGGSGAAVAARTCLGALGTDTGGSIRLPSSVNGIVGIRPTIGRVSNYNVVPLAWTMDTVSPMTRTVEDCVVMCEPSAYHQQWLRTRAADYGADVRTLLELGEMYLATHYIQAQRYRSLLRKEFLEGFKRVDVFLTPTLPFTATPCGATEVVIEGN